MSKPEDLFGMILARRKTDGTVDEDGLYSDLEKYRQERDSEKVRARISEIQGKIDRVRRVLSDLPTPGLHIMLAELERELASAERSEENVIATNSPFSDTTK